MHVTKWTYVVLEVFSDKPANCGFAETWGYMYVCG